MSITDRERCREPNKVSTRRTDNIDSISTVNCANYIYYEVHFFTQFRLQSETHGRLMVIFNNPIHLLLVLMVSTILNL